MWKDEGGPDFVVMNGPDEQFISGLAMGATGGTGGIGGIGGTYAVMPELFQKVYDLYQNGEMKLAAEIQNEICRAIYKLCSAHGNLYAVMKAILKKHGMESVLSASPCPLLLTAIWLWWTRLPP